MIIAARRDAAGGRPVDVRDLGKADRPDADERLEHTHHRRLHARRDREDDDDLAGS
jgi:hypothetical protein